MKNKLTILYAPNINGLGAKVWLNFKLSKIKEEFVLYINDQIKIDLNIKKKNLIKFKNLFSFNFFYIIFACFFIKKKLNTNVNVMGDYPLPFVKKHNLYLNQANLIDPKFYNYSSKKIMFRLKRVYFKFFVSNVKNIYVQSNFMKKYISRSYPEIKKKIIVEKIIMPKMTNFKKNNKNRKNFKILYPSNIYDYKNHNLIIDLVKTYKIDKLNFFFTCNKNDFKRFENSRNIFREKLYDHKKFNEIFRRYDAIIYPSLIESFGLPLLEAKNLNIPIFAAKLPYAKEILSKKGIYFDPLSSKSLYMALKKYFKF